MSLSFSSHTLGGRRLVLVLAGIGLAGSGLIFGQSRAERPMPQPQARPMDRSIERPVDRPRPSMDNPRAPLREGAPTRDLHPGSRPNSGMSDRPANLRIVDPRPMARCTSMPNPEYWQRRDIMAEIQWMARRGNITVNPVNEDIKALTGVSQFPAGWIAYGFRVPAGDSIKVSLDHPNRGWFRLMMVNKWGSLEEGMLQNVLHTYEPVVTYKNPSKETRAVYVIVDDPGWMSSKENPFNLAITRSWEPGEKKVDDAIVVTGIWAKK